MFILALDASTTAIGYAIFEDADLLESGVYVLPAKSPWWERVSCFGDWLWSTLLAYPFTEAIAYELATGDHGNVHTHRLLGAVEYQARIFAFSHKLPFFTVTASQVRATECHKKSLAKAEAVKKGPLDEKYAGDEADAIGVGLAMWKIIKVRGWAEENTP